LPLSCTLGVLLDYAVGFAMLLVLLAVFHIALTPAILALPLLVAVTLLLAMGLGLFSASLMVTYRDVQYIIPVFTQFLMYASPVAYEAALVTGRAKAFFGVNPLVGLMEAFRWSCLGTPLTNWGPLGYSAAFSIIAFILGAVAFQRMERRFADVI
jgi:lipopolysaccharide transport system permease protein